MNKKIEKILNNQIEKEAYSSHLYLAMASWAEQEGYSGVAQWLYLQSDEERMHMLKIINYINERGGCAKIPALEEPPADFKDIKTCFEEVLKHEQMITESIHKIVQLCIEEKDHSTYNWIQWFVTEQMEEEKSVKNILDKIKLIGNNNLYMLDRDIVSMRNVDSSGTN